MSRFLSIILGVAFLCACCNSEQSVNERWSAEKANEWAEDKGWIVGCDFVVSSAINQIEMWQAESFDPEAIDRELGYAESLGFNTVRIFFSSMVYKDDPNGLKDRFAQVLDICEKHNIRTIPTFWTNGGKNFTPYLGKQPEPIKGVHNSQWIQDPGFAIVNDPNRWGDIEKMMKDIITTFREDQRVLMWCLYNEPENLRHGTPQAVHSSVPLLKASFAWARSCKPTQPLTAPIWKPVGWKQTSMPEVTFVLENSDVLSFHSYEKPEHLEQLIQQLLPYGRPIVCTEYMRRPQSTFEGSMPVFKKYNVGAISWGLCAGKLNCNYPWNEVDANGNSIPWEEEPEVWFHDIFRTDGTTYSEAEVDFIRTMTGAKK